MLPGGSRTVCIIYSICMLPGLDLYYADPAQPLTKVGEELDDLQQVADHDRYRLYMIYLSGVCKYVHSVSSYRQVVGGDA